MEIKVNDISITLTDEQLKVIQIGLVKSEPKIVAPPKGTLVYVWDGVGKPFEPYVRYSAGNVDNNGRLFVAEGISWKHWEVVPMGISFSDETITSKDITPDMDKCLALCWDDCDKSEKTIKIIDAVNRCSFCYTGGRDGGEFNNYKLCTTPVGNLPQMYIDMIKACED